MAENLNIPEAADKKTRYQSLIPQIAALVDGENDTTANLANIMAALKEAFDFLWVGCYFVKNGELVLGPFQGPVACTRIGYGKGVCGTAWQQGKTLIVDDVNQFPGHIVCNSMSRSEIVLPVFNGQGEVKLILDIDSEKIAAFDAIDQKYLSHVTALIEKFI